MLTLVSVMLINFVAFAAEKSPSPTKCETVAKNEIDAKFGKDFKDFADVYDAECERKISRKKSAYYSCEVGVAGRDGAGDKTYLALVSENCERVFASFLIGEE